MDVLYDAIVIGAGVEGSSAAYNIANNDGVKQVALLEQVRNIDTRLTVGITCDNIPLVPTGPQPRELPWRV